MHVGQLRKEFDDLLFTRTASGPGVHPRRAAAGQPGGRDPRPPGPHGPRGQPGRRTAGGCCGWPRPHLFAEHAAPGLIELFAGRADDLEVELSVHPAAQFAGLLATRTVDVAIGPAPSAPLDGAGPAAVPASTRCVAVAGPDHPLAGRRRRPPTSCASQSWHLGPSAVERRRRGARDAAAARRPRAAPADLPERRGRARGDQAQRRASRSRSRFAVAGDLAAGRLVPLDGPRPAGPGPLVRAGAARGTTRPRPRPSCCASSPRRGRPRRWCAAPACTSAGSSRPCTSPSGADGAPVAIASKTLGQRAQGVRRAGRRRSTAAPRPSTRPAARSRGPPRAGSARPPGARVGAGRAITAASSAGRSLSQPSEAITSTPPRTALPCRDAQQLAQAARRGGCRRTGPRPAAPASATAAAADRCASAGVSRVSEVENANVSARRVRGEDPHQVQVRRGVALHRLAHVARAA